MRRSPKCEQSAEGPALADLVNLCPEGIAKSLGRWQSTLPWTRPPTNCTEDHAVPQTLFIALMQSQDGVQRPREIEWRRC